MYTKVNIPLGQFMIGQFKTLTIHDYLANRAVLQVQIAQHILCIAASLLNTLIPLLSTGYPPVVGN